MTIGTADIPLAIVKLAFVISSWIISIINEIMNEAGIATKNAQYHANPNDIIEKKNAKMTHPPKLIMDDWLLI